jgi:hypothetical protein
MNRRRIREVLKRHSADLMAIPGVVGIGVGEYQSMPCILVFIREKKAAILRQIPNILEGYAVQVEESGDFRARAGPT